MVSSTRRHFETLNPPLIVVIWASNLFLLEAEEIDKKKTRMFEDGGVDVNEPLGDI